MVFPVTFSLGAYRNEAVRPKGSGRSIPAGNGLPGLHQGSAFPITFL